MILAAAVIGKAAAIFEGGHATMTQSFGPEARGGSSSAQVILSGEPILYPYITRPDILVVMSQEAYTRFSPELKPGGILITEQELVRVDSISFGRESIGVPATRSGGGVRPQSGAEYRDGGFFGAVTDLASPEALRKAVADSVPPAMQKLNLEAFDKGFAYGSELMTKNGYVSDAVIPTLEAV